MTKATTRVPARRTAREPDSASEQSAEGMVVGADLPFSPDIFLRTIWQGIETGLIVYSPDGERLMTNPSADAILKDGEGQVTGRVIYLADGMSLCPEAEWPLNRALAGEIVRNEELLVCDEAHPAGRRLLCNAYPIELTNERIGALISFYDMTERWDEQQANRTTLDQLTTLLNGAAGYAILHLGAEGEVHSWSPNAQGLLGYERDDIIGKPYAVFFTTGDRASGVPEEILARAREHGVAETTGRRVCQDGSTFWADGVTTAIRGREGDVSGFVKVIHDVTSRYEAERSVEQLNQELRQLNEQLEARVRERTALLEDLTAELMSANAELEAFSYSVSHDLRAPVRAVHGFARILHDQYQELIPDEGRGYLRRIEDGATRMGELIDALLRLSRMQRQPMEVRPVDMEDLVRRCWDTLIVDKPELATVLTSGPLLPALGDPQLLRQVWMNLLDNAIKYSAGTPEPAIAVSSRAEDGHVVYSVQDNGAGFDPRYSAKLFKVFQRLHRTDDFEGIGIGLAIVHRVVLRHGGTVGGIGEPGKGATFSFALPAGTQDATGTGVGHVG